MHDEKGYIRFTCEWKECPPPAGPLIDQLLRIRNELFDVGMVGVHPDGIGFGNVSVRIPDSGTFWITGTATGHIPRLDPKHAARVTGFDLDRNSIRAEGPARPSSESLLHAAVYAMRPDIGAVLHVHQRELWQQILGKVSTTPPAVEAGSPDIARAAAAFVRARSGLIAMGGHRDGIIAYGADLAEAMERLEAASCFPAGDSGK